MESMGQKSNFFDWDLCGVVKIIAELFKWRDISYFYVYAKATSLIIRILFYSIKFSDH
jgi:hypothetical protein